MTRFLVLGVLVLGFSGFALAQHTGGAADTAPEIDPGQAVSALALVSGSVMVIRGRRKQ